ncbi:hypothetical protein BDW74DRAFT_188089 [Aspergillus multicolor]|uniref:uncharacterized protein n=1 Tax=Aspergillus multicolor TaxID=41759 RepID=UPI003CCD6F5F
MATEYHCNFTKIHDFFVYATANGLNITAEVEECKELCPLTFGFGNPDLSGIGMMYAYSIQVGLTILLGPVYRMLYFTFALANKLIADLQSLQAVFFTCNGFLIASCAMASLAHLSQDLPTFEIAGIQAMIFLQINSLLVTFFCMVCVTQLTRWAARIFLYIAIFAIAIAALSNSQLVTDSRRNWRLVSDACAEASRDYDIINPVPYPSWAVVIFAAAGTLVFWLQSLKRKFRKQEKLQERLLTVVSWLWVLNIGLCIAGMVFGLAMMWRQRSHLRRVVGMRFRDDDWNFGQFMALSIWAPIPVGLLYELNDSAQEKFPRWKEWNDWVRVHFTPRNALDTNNTARSLQKHRHTATPPDIVVDDQTLLLSPSPASSQTTPGGFNDSSVQSPHHSPSLQPQPLVRRPAIRR